MEQRRSLIRDSAAAAIWVFLYAQAVDGVTENRVRPNMVTTMGDSQAALVTIAERDDWYRRALARRLGVPVDRWYGENTRESIRDETINGMVACGAILEDSLPPASSRPRYRLASHYAELFNPALTGDELNQSIRGWRETYLSPAARTRIGILRDMSLAQGQVSIELPSGGTRIIPAGPSAQLAKATVERMLPRFFHQPIVLALAEGRARTHYEDARRLRDLGLELNPRLMPDLLAADLAAGPRGDQLLLVAVELVATSGEMNPTRLAQIANWLQDRDHGKTALVAGTVFLHRRDSAALRLGPNVAWGTFIWYAAEPQFVTLRIANPHGAALSAIQTTPQSVLEASR